MQKLSFNSKVSIVYKIVSPVIIVLTLLNLKPIIPTPAICGLTLFFLHKTIRLVPNDFTMDVAHFGTKLI